MARALNASALLSRRLRIQSAGRSIVFFKCKEPKTRIPVDALMAILDGAEVKPAQRRDSVRFTCNGLETHIRMTDCDITTYDGLRLDQIISIRTDVPKLAELGLPLLGTVNAFAGLSALVRVGDGFTLASRMPLYRGEAAVPQYVHLIAWTALIQSVWLKQLAQWMTGLRREMPLPEIPFADDACLWGVADFRVVGDLLRARHLVTTDGEAGMTSEFPWEPGAMTAVLHQRTSLFELYATKHPFLGNGIICKLELPVAFDPEDVAVIAAGMNEGEINATDAAPFFGAWRPVQDTGRIAFVAFQPNLLRSIGMHSSMAMWSMARSSAAKQLLDDVAGCV